MRLKTFGGLWIEDPEARRGSDVTPPRPRPLALLAILAADAPKGTSRERALGILWPESDPERARHALSQTLYSLKRDLGADVVVATPDLRLDRTLVSSDIEEFRAAVAAKDWARAAELYAGPFLEGFYLGDAPEFERWAEQERGVLATSGMRAIESFAHACAEAGRPDEAADQWQRLTRLDPLNARYAASYMEALAGLGDRAAALAHGKSHTELVRRELEAPPDRIVVKLVARLREAERLSQPVRLPTAPAPDAPASPSPAPPSAASPASTSTPVPRATLRTRRIGLATAVVAALTLAAFAWRTRVAVRAEERPVLAVGKIHDLVAPDSVALGGVLSEMLSTSLARVTALQVIANSRILELTPREQSGARGALTDAARRAGATEVIEGELSPVGDTALRLHIRRVDVARGLVRGAYRLEGPDRIALFDSVTALIAADLGVGVPHGSLAEVSTRSPIAYRLYEEGLRAFFQFDVAAASRLFRAAIQEDSAFATATYYAWRAAVFLQDTSADALGRRAVELADRAPPRDRLLIRTYVGATQNDPTARLVGDSLASLYPRDPEALLRAAEVQQDFARAVALLKQSIALDSSAVVPAGAVCRLCVALEHLASRYHWQDSIPAARATLERWIRMRPTDPEPWSRYSDLQVAVGDARAAAAARRRYLQLGGREGDMRISTLTTAIRLDDLDTAAERCRSWLASAEPNEYVRLRWYCTIALRNQGRHRDAMALNADGRVPGTAVTRRDAPPDRWITAILDFESGRPSQARDGYLAIARRVGTPGDDSERRAASRRARNVTWYLTLAATAAVAADDTARARALADSIELTAQPSGFARDPLLHHFVRGLLLAREARHDAAVREYRAAMYSPTYGYTRINYEMGRSLAALHRAAEAVPTVRAALRGGVEGSGLYLTRTETHELLARLFAAAGQRDSAAAHFDVVARSWRAADPPLRARADSARGWLTRNGRGVSSLPSPQSSNRNSGSSTPRRIEYSRTPAITSIPAHVAALAFTPSASRRK